MHTIYTNGHDISPLTHVFCFIDHTGAWKFIGIDLTPIIFYDICPLGSNSNGFIANLMQGMTIWPTMTSIQTATVLFSG